MADSESYEGARAAFNARFGTDVQDAEVVRRMLETSELQECHAVYQARTGAGPPETAAERTVPPHLWAAGMRPEEWAEAQTGRKMVSEAQVTYNKACQKAKERYQRSQNDAKLKRDAAFRGISPMARATTLTYEDLPSAARARVDAVDDDARKDRIKREVDWLTREAIRQARTGELDLESVGPPDPAVLDGALSGQTPAPSSGNGSAA